MTKNNKPIPLPIYLEKPDIITIISTLYQMAALDRASRDFNGAEKYETIARKIEKQTT